MQRDWRTSTGNPVANRDPWEKLLSQVNLYAHWGCQVRFWLIRRALNTCADAAAKKAAEEESQSERYVKVIVGGQ